MPNIDALLNKKNKMDGLSLLKEIDNETLKLVFFDPQYRGILDKMNYGNEGARQKERAKLPAMSEEIIEKFLVEINRGLKKSGYLMLWVDKFHLVEGVVPWVKNTELNVVDLITWDKGKIGMGYRTRRKCEYLVIFQKTPKLAKATWKIHNIPDVWAEKIKPTHAHSKPIQLQATLIKATTEEGDLVLDPAAGGFSVFEACKLTQRNFIGCDLIVEKEENSKKQERKSNG